MGGTNAHVVLEEAPPTPDAETPRPFSLLCLSARSDKALQQMAARLGEHLEEDGSLADAAWTLATGRAQLPHRCFVVAQDAAQARQKLAETRPSTPARRRSVAFLFPGQGAQHARMAARVFAEEPVFADSLREMDDALEGLDLLRLLQDDGDGSELAETRVTQPALFAVELSLARLWMSWGVAPDLLIGHSVGEIVAATLAGVFSASDGLTLVRERGRLMQSMPRGSMAVVSLPEAELRDRLGDGLAIAAVNEASSTVVSGPADALELLVSTLTAEDVAVQTLKTSHAFHSAMMDPVLPQLEALIADLPRHPPRIPFVSNVTGRVITDEQAVDPGYWAGQLRSPVRFADGLATVFEDPDRLLLEVGPGTTLSTLARRHGRRKEQPIVASLPHPKDDTDELEVLNRALGTVWAAGVSVNWSEVYRGHRGFRIPLPTYPFEKKRHWVSRRQGESTRRSQPADWLYAPTWQRTGRPQPSTPGSATWIAAPEEYPWLRQLCEQLEARGTRTVLTTGPASGAESSLGEVESQLGAVDHVVFVPPPPGDDPLSGFLELLALGRALAERARPRTLTILSRGAWDVTGDEPLAPSMAMLGPAARALAHEVADLRARTVDLAGELPTPDLIDEIEAVQDPDVARRGRTRWIQRFEPQKTASRADLAPGAVVLVTGGLRGMGLELARRLHRKFGARLALLGRAPLPDRSNAIQELQDAGAEVLGLQADVTDAEQLKRAVDEVHSRFGPVHGIVHAAGLPGGQSVTLKSDADARAVLAPKVTGTLNLERILGDEVAWMVLCSSLASEIVGFGQMDYVAANAFLDAFAIERQTRRSLPTIALDWDTWSEVGMAVETAVPQALQAGRDLHLKLGIRNDEGGEVLERALAAGEPRLLVSTRDLQPRLHPEADDEPPPIESVVDEEPDESVEAVTDPPRGTVERTVAQVWQTLFGIPAVGRHDDFFELGGHSLLATQILNRLRKSYPQSELSLKGLFENPTVAGLAAQIEADSGGRSVDPRAILEADAADRSGQVHEYIEHLMAKLGATRSGDVARRARDIVWELKKDLELHLYPHELGNIDSLPELSRFVERELARREQPPPPQSNVPAGPVVEAPAGLLTPPPKRNDPIAFVLSAPRAGSTLLRLMLAGHSRLFCPPRAGPARLPHHG